jgi:hypothetical protein
MYWITVTMLGMAHYFFRKGSSLQIRPDTEADSGESDTKASDAHETRAGEPDTSASDIDAPDSTPQQPEDSLERVTDPGERHRLYTRQIETAYRNRRNTEEDLNTAMTLSLRYVKEFDSLKPAVLDTMEEGDRVVPVFRMLAIMLEEAGAYDQAVDICRQAQAHGIEDGTRTGFEGRIRRLMKKKEPYDHQHRQPERRGG